MVLFSHPMAFHECQRLIAFIWDCLPLVVAPSLYVYDPLSYICHHVICKTICFSRWGGGLFAV